MNENFEVSEVSSVSFRHPWRLLFVVASVLFTEALVVWTMVNYGFNILEAIGGAFCATSVGFIVFMAMNLIYDAWNK